FRGPNAFPRAGNFDQNPLATNPGILVHADQLAGLGQRSLGVKTKAGIDLSGDTTGNDLEDLATEGDEQLVHERNAAGRGVAGGPHGKVECLVHEVLVVRLLGRLEKERRIRGRVLRLVFGDGFEIARVGHDGRVAFQRFEKIHAVTSSRVKVWKTSSA